MTRRRSIPHFILAGLLLSAIPALSLARQSFAAAGPTLLTLPAIIKSDGAQLQAITEINTLQLNDLAGTKTMAVGDVIYVHLSTAPGRVLEDFKNSQTHTFNYAYAVSQNRPLRTDSSTVSLRGVVTSRSSKSISVRYMFENLPGLKTLNIETPLTSSAEAELLLTVNQRAVGHIKTISIGAARYGIN